MTTTAQKPPKERYYIHNQKMTDVMKGMTVREMRVFMVLCQYALSPGYPNAGLVSYHGRRLTYKTISKLTGINANHIYGVISKLAANGKIEIKDGDIKIKNWENLQPKPKNSSSNDEEKSPDLELEDDEEKSPKLGLEDEEKSPNLGLKESQLRTQRVPSWGPQVDEYLDHFNTDQSTNQTSSADEVGPAETVGLDTQKDSDSNGNGNGNGNDTTTAGNGNSKAQPIEDVDGIREMIEGWEFPDGKPMTEFGIKKIIESGMSKHLIEKMFDSYPKCNAGFFVKSVGTDKLKIDSTPESALAHPKTPHGGCPRRDSDLKRWEAFIPTGKNHLVDRLVEFGIPMTMYCATECGNSWDTIHTEIKQIIETCHPDNPTMKKIVEKSYTNGDYYMYPQDLIFWESTFFSRTNRKDLLPSDEEKSRLRDLTTSYD